MAHEDIQVDVRRNEGIKVLAEGRHAVQQMGGVERHVDARDLDEGTRPRRAALGVGTQGVKPRASTGDGVLDACNVVVDDLQELAGLRGNLSNVREHVLGGDADLVRTQRRQSIVGVALGVALDQAVHGQATGVDDLYDCFEGEHLRVGGEGVVLAHGVARKVGAGVKDAGLLHLGDLRAAQGGHGYLRELGQEKSAVRVRELLAAHGDGLRIVAHDLQDGESQLGAGVLVRAFPYGAGV